MDENSAVAGPYPARRTGDYSWKIAYGEAHNVPALILEICLYLVELPSTYCYKKPRKKHKIEYFAI